MGNILNAGLLSAGTKLGELGIMSSAEKNKANDRVGEDAIQSVFETHPNKKTNNSGYLFYIIGIVGVITLIYILRG